MTAAPISRWAKRKRPPDPAKREAILAQAARLFVERGYENTSLIDLAETLHLAKPTLYHYFESKEAILHEIIERSHVRNESVLEKAREAGLSGRDKLRLVCERYAVHMTDDFGKVQAKLNWRAFPSEPRERLREKLLRSDTMMRSVIVEGIEDGSLPPMDVKLATFMIFGSLNWVAYWHRDDGELAPEELAKSLVDLMFSGLDRAMIR